MANPSNSQIRVIPVLIIGAAAWHYWGLAGRVVVEGVINPVAAAAAGVFVMCALKTLSQAFAFLARFFDWMKARTPTGLKGTAGWIKNLKEIKHELVPLRLFWSSWGPYWGMLKEQPIFSHFINALIIGPTGSGKTAKVLIPLILSIRDSKIIMDFKGELACILAKCLRKRGEVVRILNFGGLYLDILGESDCYNPLHLIADDFWRPGGICEVTSDISEFNYKLLDEPSHAGGSADNIHFRDGSRVLIGYTNLQTILIHGYDATLGHGQLLINDREQMLKDALWAAGKLKDKDGNILPPMPIESSPWVSNHDPEDVQRFISYYRNIAASVAEILQDTETDEARSFLTGARQAFAPFNKTTRTSKIFSRSTFRFSDTKDDATSIFFVVDSSRMKEQSKAADIIQWCAAKEIQRARDIHTRVYFFADEVTNYRIDIDMLTWARGYGLHTVIVTQTINAFQKAYSREDFQTVWSETEIKVFLPGIKEPETLDLLEKQLGQESLVTTSHSGNNKSGPFGVEGFDLREEGRPLKFADEIRRNKKTFLIIRDNKAAEIDTPFYSETSPWRNQVGINPFHGKPFKLPVVLKLHRRDGILPVRVVKYVYRAVRWLMRRGERA